MKNRWSLLIVLLLFSSNVLAESSMRCGNQLVYVGNSKAEVMITCGEPMLKETIAFRETSRQFSVWNKKQQQMKQSKKAASSNKLHINNAITISEPVDQWTYYLGQNHFLRYLIFQGGKLVEIKTGEKL